MQRTERGERGKRDLYLITHSAHVHSNCVRTLVDELAAERTNHVERLSVRGPGVSIQREFESYAVSQTDTVPIFRMHTNFRMRLHFYSIRKIQIGPSKKCINHTMNCFPREHHRV